MERVYLNGEIVAAERACIRPDDVGFLHGGSVFTTLMARGGRAMRLERHVARLLETAGLFGMRVGADATLERLSAAVGDVLEANDLSGKDEAGSAKKARLRITLTPGDVQGDRPTTFVTAAPLPEYPAEMYERGISVVVSSFKQAVGDPTYGNKTGCYFPRILARQEAHRKGAQEALWFTPDNRLAEGCFTNVFLVVKGKVMTPARDTPALPGVTRGAVLELCREMDISCKDDQDLHVTELLGAEEIFLTAGTMGVVPVSRVERHAVGDERVGAVTLRIMEAYNQLVERETS